MITQVCKKCQVEKSIESYSRDSSVSSGYKVTCKICATSARIKSEKKPEYSKKYYLKNKDRLKKYQQARKRGEDTSPYIKTNTELLKIREDNYNNRSLKKRYREKAWVKQGIIDLDYKKYQEMLTLQNGVCFLCKRPPYKNKSLCADHNHETGKVRKLLCFDCNTALGKLGDNVLSLTRALNYLKEHE